VTDWFENDALFCQECKKGHFWERYVAFFFAGQGLKVELGPQQIRENVAQAAAYVQEVDLFIEGHPVEVKSRAVTFHTRNDFPYPDIMVDTVKGWDAKEPKPTWVICVSQVTGAIITLVGLDKETWTAREVDDQTRKIRDTFYFAEKGYWYPVETCVSWFRQHRAAKAPLLGRDI